MGFVLTLYCRAGWNRIFSHRFRILVWKSRESALAFVVPPATRGTVERADRRTRSRKRNSYRAKPSAKVRGSILSPNCTVPENHDLMAGRPPRKCAVSRVLNNNTWNRLTTISSEMSYAFFLTHLHTPTRNENTRLAVLSSTIPASERRFFDETGIESGYDFGTIWTKIVQTRIVCGRRGTNGLKYLTVVLHYWTVFLFVRTAFITGTEVLTDGKEQEKT